MACLICFCLRKMKPIYCYEKSNSIAPVFEEKAFQQKANLWWLRNLSGKMQIYKMKHEKIKIPACGAEQKKFPSANKSQGYF